MKSLITSVVATCLMFSTTGCNRSGQEDVRENAERLKEKTKEAAQNLKREAKDLGSTIKTEARKVGATPESGSAQSAEEKLRRGTAELQQESQKAGTKLSQATQTAKVKYNLTTTLGLAAVSNIDVNSDGNTVTLQGTVSSSDNKAEAERSALGTDGVTKVVNRLQVKP